MTRIVAKYIDEPRFQCIVSVIIRHTRFNWSYAIAALICLCLQAGCGDAVDHQSPNNAQDAGNTANCGDTRTQCGDQCVDLNKSPEHCGRCNHQCADGHVCARGYCAPSKKAARVVHYTNVARSKRQKCGKYGVFKPAGKLEPHPQLHRAAMMHAKDMATGDETGREFFSHTGSDGSNFAVRIRRTDYRGIPVAENIATGQRKAKQVVIGSNGSWIASPGHCKNIMLQQAEQIGVAFLEDDDGGYENLWVQVFGRTAN